MRKLSIALAGAVAAAGLALSAGTAGASTVHTESASKCGTTWCGYVNGPKLKVKSVTVSRKNKKAWSGYIYLEVTRPGHHLPDFYWTNKYFKNVKFARGDLNKTLPNKTLLCAGAATKKQNINHAGAACFTIHK